MCLVAGDVRESPCPDSSGAVPREEGDQEAEGAKALEQEEVESGRAQAPYRKQEGPSDAFEEDPGRTGDGAVMQLYDWNVVDRCLVDGIWVGLE